MSNNNGEDLKKKIKSLEEELAFLRMYVQFGLNDNINHLNNSSNYFSYLWSLTKQNNAYKIIRKFSNYFSKFKLITLILKLIELFTLAIEASAFIFILSTLIIFLLPPIILYMFIIFICSTLFFKRNNQTILLQAYNKNVIVYFLSRRYPFSDNCFFLRNALELSSHHYCVIIVSPFIISPLGISKQKRNYLNIRKEAEGIFLIRQLYFFHIRKLLFKNHRNRIIYVY